jgi:hypothetical protein
MNEDSADSDSEKDILKPIKIHRKINTQKLITENRHLNYKINNSLIKGLNISKKQKSQIQNIFEQNRVKKASKTLDLIYRHEVDYSDKVTNESLNNDLRVKKKQILLEDQCQQIDTNINFSN